MKNLIIALSLLFPSMAVLYSQATITWAGFPAGGTSYTSGVMTATVTSNAAGFQNGAPKYYAGSTVGNGQCGIAGGLSLEHLFGNITNAHATLNMDFTSGNTTSGICGNISFQIKDINAEESYQSFADWIEVSAIDGNNNPVPIGNITASGGSNKTITASGNVRIVKGYNNGNYQARNSTVCDNVTFTINPSAGTLLKSVIVKYHPEYAVDQNEYFSFYNPKRPAFQYISISEITVNTANGPTAVQLTAGDAGCNAANGNVTIGNVTGGSSPFTFDFNNSGFGNTTFFDNLAPNNYTVIVKDNNGCTLNANVTVNTAPGPTAVQLTKNDAGCNQSDGNVTIGNVTGGVGPFSYNFNNNGFASTTFFDNLAPGNYTVAVKDNNGCTFNSNITVAITTGPTAVQLTAENANCGQSSGSVTIGNVTGGTGPFTFNFNNNGFTSGAFFDQLVPGNYTVIVKDSHGCTYNSSIGILSSTGPTTLNISLVQPDCGQNNGNIALINVTGGTSPYQFNFNNAGFTSTLNVSNLGSGNYSVRVKDSNGCFLDTLLTLNSSNGPTAVNTSQTIDHCQLGSGTLSILNTTGGASPYQYNFNHQGYTSQTDYNNLTAGSYPLITRDANGCTYSSQIVIQNTPSITNVTVNVEDEKCTTGTGAIHLNTVTGGTAPYQYNFNNNGFSGIRDFNNLTSGSFMLEIKDANGCLLDTNITVAPYAYEALAMEFNITHLSCAHPSGRIEIVNTTGGKAPYTFEFNHLPTPNNTFHHLTPGIYEINVIDADHCSRSYSLPLENHSEIPYLYIPNVFTPNDDHANDTWFIQADCVKEIECVILNRWGQMLKKLEHINDAWDGFYDGERVLEGTYFYQLKITFWSGESGNYHGHLSLIR